MSGTWILFTSGQAVEIIVNRTLSAKVGGNPADVYVVAHSCHQSFQESAQRAAALSYYWAETKGLNPQPYAAGIDLAGIKKGDALTGESGGVAFAVALAKLMFEYDPGPVAATGVVSPRDGGRIEAIRGLSAKLDAAVENLPAGSWVFYPRENLEPADDPMVAEIQEKIIKLQNKGYKLHSVSTLSEVLERLFPLKTVAVKQKRQFRSGWVLLAVLVVLGLIATQFSWRDVNSEIKSIDPVAESGAQQGIVVAVGDGEIVQPPVAGISSTVNLSAESESSGSAPESQVAALQLPIRIEGKGRLGTELADRVTNLLLAQPNLSLEPPAAKLRILGLTEEMQLKGMLSSLSLEVSALNFQLQNETVTLPIFPLTLEQPGAIEEALPGIARQLSEHLLLMVSSRTRAPSVANDEKSYGTVDQKAGFE
ncbi:MAG: hypothetical protein L3J63_02440 [Geopsychrobacter sp.]|nr:hypothetical protein [Geopsychrobacter sp.]